VQGEQSGNEALQLTGDEDPADAGNYEVRIPKLDRGLILVVALVFVVVLGWAATITAVAVEMATDLDAVVPIVAAVFAGMAGCISVQVAIDFLRRRRQWAYTTSLRETACLCHAETLKAIADLARRLDLAPADEAPAAEPPPHAAQVFEMGRRVGARQAARALAQSAAPLGS
jgi:hypothetical protein